LAADQSLDLTFPVLAETNSRLACVFLFSEFEHMSLFVKGAVFVNRNYVTNDAAAFAKNI